LRRDTREEIDPRDLAVMARCPVTIGLCLGSLVVTLGWWYELFDLGRLDLHPRAFGDQPWRVVTSTLAHARFPAHLIFNAYMTWRLGVHLEARVGSLRMLPLYLFLASGSMGLQLALSAPAIGMSGVVYGFAGLIWVLEQRDRRFAGILGPGMAQMLVVWFFVCIFMTATKVMAVANVAHGAGALYGILLGHTWLGRQEQRLIYRVGLSLLALLTLLGATVAMPWTNFAGSRWAARLTNEGAEQYEDSDYEAALDTFALVLRLDDEQGPYWFNYGLAQWQTGARAEAVAAHERALQLEPDNAEFRVVRDERRAFLRLPRSSGTNAASD